eukprot:INCI2987.2.p1 GENE.INCI2987.2~~INCI2987.2.p1  ORF type:complete len:1110 (+),score=232.07 INCI2987.2:41-3370(+)
MNNGHYYPYGQQAPPQYAQQQQQQQQLAPQYAQQQQQQQPQHAQQQPQYAHPQQQPRPMQQTQLVQAIVPAGVGPGGVFEAQNPDGTKTRVTVPPGVGPGQLVRFHAPVASPQPSPQQYQQPQQQFQQQPQQQFQQQPQQQFQQQPQQQFQQQPFQQQPTQPLRRVNNHDTSIAAAETNVSEGDQILAAGGSDAVEQAKKKFDTAVQLFFTASDYAQASNPPLANIAMERAYALMARVSNMEEEEQARLREEQEAAEAAEAVRAVEAAEAAEAEALRQQHEEQARQDALSRAAACASAPVYVPPVAGQLPVATQRAPIRVQAYEQPQYAQHQPPAQPQSQPQQPQCVAGQQQASPPAVAFGSQPDPHASAAFAQPRQYAQEQVQYAQSDHLARQESGPIYVNPPKPIYPPQQVQQQHQQPQSAVSVSPQAPLQAVSPKPPRQRLMECMNAAQNREAKAERAFATPADVATVDAAKVDFERAIEYYFTAGDLIVEVGESAEEADAVMEKGYHCMQRLEDLREAHNVALAATASASVPIATYATPTQEAIPTLPIAQPLIASSEAAIPGSPPPSYSGVTSLKTGAVNVAGAVQPEAAATPVGGATAAAPTALDEPMTPNEFLPQCIAKAFQAAPHKKASQRRRNKASRTAGMLEHAARLGKGITQILAGMNSVEWAKAAKHTVTSELMRPERRQCFITEHVVPDVFRSFREGAGFDEDQYQRSLTGSGAFSGGGTGAGKSGMLFFTTGDRRLVLKTLKFSEKEKLLSVLRSYHAYMTQALGPGGRGSLLSRFMDVFNVTVKSLKRTENTESWTTSDRMLLVVMNNVFHSDDRPECCGLELHQIFDLKGSTVNREEPLTPEQAEYGVEPFMFPERIKVPVMKDVNLLSDVRNFVYVQSNADKERIMEIIAADSAWLCSHDLMDYSMIVGVHRRREAPAWYFIAIIDLLQAYDMHKRTENLLRGHMLPMFKKIASTSDVTRSSSASFNSSPGLDRSASQSSLSSYSLQGSPPHASEERAGTGSPPNAATTLSLLSLEQLQEYVALDDVKLGRVSRGASPTDKYHFGDSIRGLALRTKIKKELHQRRKAADAALVSEVSRCGYLSTLCKCRMLS